MSTTLDIPAILKNSTSSEKNDLLAALFKERLAQREKKTTFPISDGRSSILGYFVPADQALEFNVDENTVYLPRFYVGDMDLNDDSPYMRELKRRAESA